MTRPFAGTLLVISLTIFSPAADGGAALAQGAQRPWVGPSNLEIDNCYNRAGANVAALARCDDFAGAFGARIQVDRPPDGPERVSASFLANGVTVEARMAADRDQGCSGIIIRLEGKEYWFAVKSLFAVDLSRALWDARKGDVLARFQAPAVLLVSGAPKDTTLFVTIWDDDRARIMPQSECPVSAIPR